jgi:hypothetical protein
VSDGRLCANAKRQNTSQYHEIKKDQNSLDVVHGNAHEGEEPHAAFSQHIVSFLVIGKKLFKKS